MTSSNRGMAQAHDLIQDEPGYDSVTQDGRAGVYDFDQGSIWS